jgi:hypothetical protein
MDSIRCVHYLCHISGIILVSQIEYFFGFDLRPPLARFVTYKCLLLDHQQPGRLVGHLLGAVEFERSEYGAEKLGVIVRYWFVGLDTCGAWGYGIGGWRWKEERYWQLRGIGGLLTP